MQPKVVGGTKNSFCKISCIYPTGKRADVIGHHPLIPGLVVQFLVSTA